MSRISIKKMPSFSSSRILVAGDVMLDRYWLGDTARISPEAPVPIVSIRHSDNRPGGAGNVALNISALGAHVTLIGVVGDDEAANILEEQLIAAKINTFLSRQTNLSTIIKLRVMSRHQQLMRLDFEDKLIPLDSLPFLQHYEQQLQNANIIVLSDYHKGTLNNVTHFIHLAKKAHIPILVDPKGADFSRYQHATLLTPNLKEFEAVVGKITSEQQLIEKARQLLTSLDLKALLITRGEAGMTLFEQEHMMHLPAYAREVFDVTGAGDTVIATLAAALGAGASLADATELANLSASLAVGKLGAATISAPELEAALHAQTHIAGGIMNEAQLLKVVADARAQGKKIVFTNGCFDLLHAGHVTALQLAKQLGDYLIVAVNDDSSIKRLKGPHRPINHLEHRMIVLASLGVVDWVIPFKDDTPERLLKLIQPDVLAKGSDYQLDEVVGAEIVLAYGGDVRIVSHSIDTSSTAIIERIQMRE